MKKSIFLVVLLLISISFYAQAPEKVNYQAVARNLTGAPLINQTINVKYEVRQGSSIGTVVYAENHVITTNQFGLFTAEIGGGTVITGSFPGIAWGTSPFYLYVEVDGDPMGVTQLLSVPYALYAKESGNGPAGLPGKNSLSVSSTYSGPMCSANGGSQIDVGLDDNNDGILQPIEIDFTYYVCNGTNGIVGSNGLNTLSSTVVSTTCPNGGVTVNMGLDANNNSVLDASEITVSYDVCNGANGLPGASGTNGLNSLAQTIPSTSCPNGGVTVNMGLDVNINGTLEVGEITTTYDVCNGVDGTSGTTYFAGNGISLSGDTITNTGDADADATNELQVLSFSNDTLYLSNGNSVYITPSAADNWGTDVVNTSGTNISGDGTAGNPLTVTETTTTLVDNADGTFTYTDETGTPITFDANIDDADADATNELQVLSFSNDTLYLSNGNSVYITPSAADNWGTDVVNTSGTNISGDGTAGNPLTVTETTTTLVDNADGTFTYTDETGTPITFDANIDDADADATNELQVLSFSNDTLYLSNGNSVYITPSAADNWGTDVVNTSGTNISGDGTAGNPLTVTETTTTLVDNADGTFTYTDETGTPITFDANIDDADADATNELQVLSFSNDTLYLSNGNSVYITPSAADNWGTDVVNTSGTNISGDGTAGNPLTVTETTTTLVDNADGTFTYTDETGTPITFDANIDDADADATNELQVLSFSNDTLYLSNGNSVYITPSAADNWGTDVVNTSGTNISGDGTAGNPLTVTETTTTLVDNADGTFTYTDETGTPITFDANIDDADADATNELQVLSFSNDTLYLSNGNSVYITPSAADNWGTDVVNTSGTNISGDGTAGNPLTVTETTTTLVDNADGTFTYTDETGTPITFDANIDDADADATNELQVLSFSNDTLYLSNGNSVYITPSAADNWGTDVVNTSGTNISGDGTAGNPLTVTETTTTLVDNADGTFTYTDETGTPITFDANIDDADADATNELQVLSFSNDTLYLSNGNSVYITPSAADNWGTDVVNTSGTNISGDGTAGNPLTVTETTTTLVDNADGTFTYTDETGTPITFDANIDDADADATNELQVLSFSNDTLYLSNGNSVYITPSAADNWGTDVVNTSGTNISGDGTAGNPLTVTETTTTLVDNADGTFTYTDETGTPITFDANIDDADADATNELQVLSFSNDTLYLSNGNSVYITPSAADNWGTDVVNTSGTNISGDGTAGNPLTVTESTSTLVDNADGTFTYTDETGTPITFDANIDDADADATNELQVLSFSNDTLYLSNGNSVYITPGAGDNWGTDVVNTSGTNISGNGTVGSPLTVTETTTTLVDNGNGTFTYTDETGTPITFDANIDDADADATNELQVLSFSNDTLYLSNGNSVYITPGAGDNWGTDVVNTSGTNISGNGTVGSPLTVTETTTTLVDNGNGTFTYTDETGTPITFDANIDDADADATNELQVLSFSNDTLYLSNGNSVYITPGAGDNWGTDVVNTSGTNIAGDGTAGNPLTVTESTSTLVDNADGTFTYTDETGTPITFDANIDDADADATNELQVLSFSNDTLYLSNGNSVYIAPATPDNWGTDVVNTSGTNIAGDGTAGNPLTVTESTSTLVDNADGTFTYTDETGTPITFDANIDDADADATNELQVLSFSNDTLYLSNGNSVYIAPATPDNWGTDVVNTSGTNIAGDGTAGNPLTVTESTSTLVDNADGTFTYTDETGTPITFDANIDDADADATNELQVLSFSNDTLYLSNGNSVYIAPATPDNWGTDVVNTSGTNIAGDGTAGNPLTVTESTSTLVDNADGTFTYTDETGTPITFDANIDDADADATNELQVLSFSNDTLYLSNGNSVYIAPATPDNWGTDVVNTSGTNIAGDGTAGNPLTVTESTSTLVDNADGTFTYTDETGTPITFDANIDDADADATNELQVLSLSNDTLYLSNGNSVYITPGAGDNWGSQTVNVDGTTITGDGVVTPLSGFDGQYSSLTGTPIDNDTSATNEIQVLSFSNDTLYLSNGNSVYLAKDSTNIYNSNGTLTGARIVTGGANTLSFTSTATNGFSVDGPTLSVDAANDRVGIGTTTPGALLHLEKTVSPTMVIKEVTPTNGAAFLMESTSQYMLISNQSGIFRIQDNTNSTSPFNISNTSYVGIGGDAQYSRLDVYGKITMRTGAINGYIPVSDANGTMTWTDPSTLGLGGAWTSNGTETYLNSINDKVGIGVTAPTEELHIVDNISMRPGILLETSAGNFSIGYGFKTGLAEWFIGQEEAGKQQLRFKDVFSSKTTMAISQGTGNVGIGTTTTKSTLTVNGDVGLNDGATVATNNAVTILLTNKGGAVVAGDIVVVDPSSDNSFNVTNNPGNYAVIGVAIEDIAASTVGKIAISGVVTVNINSASSVLRGQHCITGSNNGRASGVSIPSAGTSIGVFLTNGPADGTAKVLLR